MTSSRLRWAVPAAAVAAVAASVLVGTTPAGADPSGLAPRTAAELLDDLAEPVTGAFSGTVEHRAELGLPALPTTSAGTLGPASLLEGTTTVRVWADGPDRSRVALQGPLAEYDVIRAGADVWTWSSQELVATHLTLPAASAPPSVPPGLPATPAAAASAALAAIEPSTRVTVEDSVTVAGRSARQLVLTPRSSDTLVGSVRVAVDAETNLPLRVQVFAAGAVEPALETGFTDISVTAPDPGVFAPPRGAEVRELAAPGDGRPAAPTGPPGTPWPIPAVIGAGWSSVLILDGLDPAEEQAAQLDAFTTRVPQGRVLSTALVSVLLTDDGRLLVGAVPASVLQAAA